MHTWVLTAAVILAACAAPRQTNEKAEAAWKAEVGERIQKICSLPEPERTAELEKLKKDEGLVLYCGANGDEDSSKQ